MSVRLPAEHHHDDAFASYRNNTIMIELAQWHQNYPEHQMLKLMLLT